MQRYMIKYFDMFLFYDSYDLTVMELTILYAACFTFADMERAITLNIMSTPTQCTPSSWRCDAIAKSGEFHTIKIWDETNMKKVKKDAFLTLINYSYIKKYITITKDTKVRNLSICILLSFCLCYSRPTACTLYYIIGVSG